MMGGLRNILVLVCAALLFACSQQAPKPLHAIDVTWQHPHPAFRLTDSNGNVRNLSDFRDKVVVLFFGYTHCPEVCPTTLADLAQTMQKLGPDADKVQVLFVTLDPERDTPQVLGKFVPYFDPSFIGLRGDAQATAAAAKAFGVNYRKHYEKNGSYTLDHSDSTYLIGIGGQPIWMSRYGQRIDFLTEDIRRLIAAGM
jgi:protein SCO1/2